MDHHIKEVSLRLCRGVNDVGVVGIWGMGGIGKTTIARAVYDEIVHLFEHKCFFYNVKEGFAKKGETQMRGELLSMILKGNVQGVDIFNEGSNAILERLGTKKVLVVLDDVESIFQIKALLGNFYSFGVGSRVLVTTRDRQSLAGVNETYKPRCLDHNESLEFFMKHAFRTNHPSEEYTDLSNRAVEYAQGLPLALEVLGASLYDKTLRQWKELLEKIKKIPQRKIMDVLRTSFEGLDEPEKDIFLDIACLFRGWSKNFVTELLDSFGFFPNNGLRNLVDRALITLSYYRGVDMHDLLQEMGRQIVRLESTKEPGKRSRLWSYEDVNHVLTQNTATDAVECLILDLSNSKVDLCIHTGAFVGMTKLRLLIIYYSFYTIFDDEVVYRECEDICPVYGCKQLLSGDFEFSSQELRLLLWHGCPVKSLPSTFIPKNLVKHDMRGSHIQQLWEGIKPLQNLKVILLSHCQYLVKIPDLSEAINLEKLFLDHCSSLFELHPSIFALQNLHFLKLMECKELKILPSSIHMKSLETLDLSGCSKLEKFPEISEVMTNLECLYLGGTAIKELPSINNLTGLRVLDLEDCTELKTLSTSIHMSSLQTLNLFGCSNLEKFPEISGIMKKLSMLVLSETTIKGLPSSIDLLEGLEELTMQNCKSLVSLPDSISNFADLTDLDLTGCTELETLSTSIHMRSLLTLNLDGCSNLEKFPEISGIMKELSVLILNETAIKGLPSSIDLLEGLKQLSMRNCKSLVFLPDSICNLADLTHLYLSGCSVLHNLPEKLGDLKSLQDLDVKDSGIRQLPFSILRLRKLRSKALSCIGCKEMTAPLSAWPSSIKEYRSYSVLLHLDLSDCNLLELSDGIAHFSKLKTLQLCRNNLESLPVTIKQLGRLTYLNLEACKRLKSIPELSSSIACIDAYDCIALEKVSKPKPGCRTNHFFTFSNCFQLVQTNLFIDIVERHLQFQENCIRPLRLNMSRPGSVVPYWFNHRSEGSSVSVQLPPNWLDREVSGFAICAVRKYHHDHDLSPSSVACLCTFNGNRGEHSFSFDLLNSVRFLRSDHMFLGYESCCLIEEGKLIDETNTTATFEILVKSELETEQLWITSCGVRFLYANPDEMMNLNMPQTQVHVDICETGVCFMDPYELRDNETERAEISREIKSSSNGLRLFHGNYMEVQNESMTQPTIHVEGLGTPFFPEQLEIRKSETEWEAESSELREWRGTCQILELLPELQTERKEEEDGEISELGSHSGLIVPNSQGEGKEERELMGEESFERLLGPLCSCFYWLGEVWRGNIEK